jgi:hypothetical protein
LACARGGHPYDLARRNIDFRTALAAGVDEINHLPGFRPEGNSLAGYAKLDAIA